MQNNQKIMQNDHKLTQNNSCCCFVSLSVQASCACVGGAGGLLHIFFKGKCSHNLAVDYLELLILFLIRIFKVVFLAFIYSPRTRALSLSLNTFSQIFQMCPPSLNLHPTLVSKPIPECEQLSFHLCVFNCLACDGLVTCPGCSWAWKMSE